MRAALVLALIAVAGAASAKPRYEPNQLQTPRLPQDVRGCLMTTLSTREQPIETVLRPDSAWRIAFLTDRDRLSMTVERTAQSGTRVTYPRRGVPERVEGRVRACL